MSSRIFDSENQTGSKMYPLMIYLGISSIIIPSAVIISAVIINPWFSITHNAFSDLGANSANNSWVFNYGMIASAILIFFFAVNLSIISENRIEVTGSAFLMMTAFFLALIGIFHEGTSPHFLFSVLFFAEAALSVLTWGLGLLYNHKFGTGFSMVIMSVGGAAVALTIPFPSTALLELFGILIMFVWVVIMAFIVSGNIRGKLDLIKRANE